VFIDVNFEMKKLTFMIFLSLYFSTKIVCQTFNQKSQDFQKANQNLMLGLGSWSVGNITGSAVGWAVSDNQQWKSFHQMNVFWNAVNLGLAIPGYVKARRPSAYKDENMFQKEQLKTERLFLVNSGLDLIYITSGVLLMNTPDKKTEYQGRNLGFGSSIVLQGGFLLAFDATAYFIHRHQRLKGRKLGVGTLNFSTSGIGVKATLNF
jgi:hypothetical protein